MSRIVFAVVIVSLLAFVSCDLYMHSPRGSNNRNCEKNEALDNPNRLFDSQNNADGTGGYACPRAVGGPDVITPTMTYYVGSKLYIEWTAQHGCGNPDDNCQFILQYMCSDTAPGLRDGTPSSATDSATNTVTAATVNSTNVGSHEPMDNYDRCSVRIRDNGLFIADQGLLNPYDLSSTSPATNTRQNPNGQRYGWECQEERDYYPYWHPTPWRDVAILTTNVSRCPYYQQQSENVLPRGDCYSDAGVFLKWNNPIDCKVNAGNWVVAAPKTPADPAPICQAAAWSHDNNLGIGLDGRRAHFWWTVPNLVNNACVFRMRYNISTGDFPWHTDYTSNGAASPVQQNEIVNAGYVQPISLAMNTDQYGRTFQDRSYVFAIAPRPATISPTANIWNFGVLGKRGNIVGVYPALEYWFSPANLSVNGGDYIHFQWTGSDYNPPNNPNDGIGGPRDPVDGQLRSDRSNLIQISAADVDFPTNASSVTMFLDANGNPDTTTINNLAMINQPGLSSATTPCLNWTQLLTKNAGNAANALTDSQNCMNLSNAPNPYFNGGLVQMRASGSFHYYCSRNNNFSNRVQKGLIVVNGGEFGASTKTMINIFLVAAACIFAFFM